MAKGTLDGEDRSERIAPEGMAPRLHEEALNALPMMVLHLDRRILRLHKLHGLGWQRLGRPQSLRWLSENLQRATGWNEAAQRELDRIQTALNRVAESLAAVQ